LLVVTAHWTHFICLYIVRNTGVNALSIPYVINLLFYVKVYNIMRIISYITLWPFSVNQTVYWIWFLETIYIWIIHPWISIELHALRTWNRLTISKAIRNVCTAILCVGTQ
jgi:hypothetical protein